mmetsp:Transcript_23085/g.37194  ORF Transcript_23085/g.37194 Transcript_23085/m.37194 type:complete len:89 (+) Transcript_23085:301-567(+)
MESTCFDSMKLREERIRESSDLWKLRMMKKTLRVSTFKFLRYHHDVLSIRQIRVVVSQYNGRGYPGDKSILIATCMVSSTFENMHILC